MKKLKVLIIISAIILAPKILFADCTYNGKSYPTGTNIGGIICQPDGTWR